MYVLHVYNYVGIPQCHYNIVLSLKFIITSGSVRHTPHRPHIIIASLVTFTLFGNSRNGYKMCIRAYLNGDGMGYKTHLSLFFVLMKGEFDALLKWPFEHKISMILVGKEFRQWLVGDYYRFNFSIFYLTLSYLIPINHSLLEMLLIYLSVVCTTVLCGMCVKYTV